MAFDAYLQIDGVPGESTDSAHVGWIEIQSFVNGVAQTFTGSFSSSGAPASGKANFNTFSVTKQVDKSSPLLYKKCCTGEPIGKISLDICRATGNSTPYLNFLLNNSVVASVQTAGANAGATADDVPTEIVTFAFGKITETYTPTDAKTGKPGGVIVGGWDRNANQSV
ncbi:MAG TPA: type VI secretion system tube protein Hcp [Planctomycetaceae bacterium]|nr:type VI secretion system tube protein Hcp [Planctomycetaceae bacterium]